MHDFAIADWLGLRSVVLHAAVLAAVPTANLVAQQGAPAAHDHRAFACGEGDVAAGKPFGCQLLGRPEIARLSDGPVYWHIASFPTLRDAQTAKGSRDAVTEADGRVWLFRFGPLADTLTRGKRVASVGPLPLPDAASYRVELYYVVMPAGMYTSVHTHPGPEAWYILEGEQCLETPLGTARARAGEGSIAPPGGTPMRLTNNGAGERRALFIVAHDPARPWAAPSDWRPTGSCDH
jgi:quercetin dioxygenase-like cupin family protein